MTGDLRLGWFADTDAEAESDFPWRAYLQTPGGCFPLDGIWFATQAQCEDFMRADI